MELKQQVTSLELSKKLKELGVKQESLYKWNVPELSDEEKEKGHGYLDSELVPKLYTEEQWEVYAEDYIPPNSKIYSAFTVAELGEMLPLQLRSPNPPIHLAEVYCRLKAPKGYKVSWGGQEFFADTEANVRAKMLIYLLENKLI